MISILSVLITGLCTIVCAVIGAVAGKAQKRQEEYYARTEDRAKQRADEGKLQLAMLHANSKLTVGVAMALKHGHCNGEVEDGLKAVEDANNAYSTFLEQLAIDHITRG